MIKENYSLRELNSFGIRASARYLAAFRSVEDLQEILRANPVPNQPLLVLGGGSNILFTHDFNGLVLRNEITGIEKLKEDDDHVYVRAGAGENWHQFVLYCIRNGWAGLENLSLIPGCVGASPMQNIGAYGVELSSVFQELRAFHLKERTNYHFTAKNCEFGYRDSVFKRRYRDQFVITDVSFRLNKKPVFETSYGAIRQELEEMGVTDLSIKAVSDAVIRIRSSKLPDPAVIGNAGSFFKNPSVPDEQFRALKTDHPGLVAYKNPDGTHKLAAGWLIEQCGWKGVRRGDAGCHEKQALVLVNYGEASGEEIYRLAMEIRASVLEKFAVELETEVNIV